MISQIRIYTINKGEMDNFLKHFKDEIMVLHQKIWRTHRRHLGESATERIYLGPDLQRARRSSKRRAKSFKPRSPAAGVKLGANVAKMEVREAESAFA